MGTLATVIEAPIKGAVGNTVNVDDTVMVVTTGYGHSVSVTKGIYKGYIEGTGRYKKRARIEVQSTRLTWVKPDGSEFVWHRDYNPDTYPEVKKTLTSKTLPYTYKTTLNLNRIATLKD